MGNDTVLPNATNGAPWSSRLVGLDVVVIHPSDPKACHSNGTLTNYYIGVTSFGKNASFSLLAYATSADPITLIDGQPQTGQVCVHSGSGVGRGPFTACWFCWGAWLGDGLLDLETFSMRPACELCKSLCPGTS